MIDFDDLDTLLYFGYMFMFLGALAVLIVESITLYDFNFMLSVLITFCVYLIVVLITKLIFSIICIDKKPRIVKDWYVKLYYSYGAENILCKDLSKVDAVDRLNLFLKIFRSQNKFFEWTDGDGSIRHILKSNISHFKCSNVED